MKRKTITLLSVILTICIAFSVTHHLLGRNTATLTEILASRRDPEIEAKLEAMTLEEKVGQMFMGCFYNGTPSVETVNRYHLGSILLFSESFKDSDKTSIRSALDAIASDSDIKPIVAVDEEGGTVNRVSLFPEFRSEPFKSPRELFAAGGMDAVIDDVHEKNLLLSQLGINLNLAPVCDISQNPDEFMYSRSLGQNAVVTAQYTSKVVTACLDDNMGCCLKHFPGYGNSKDTHKGIAVDNRPLTQLEQNDFIPFIAGINAGAPAVLVSHNIVSALDGKLPASLSPAVHRLLRYDMNFDGVIITDDLSMKAISQFIPDTDSAVSAVMAGNDILCTGNFKEQWEAVVSAVKTGKISEQRIDNSVRRILLWKKSMSLF